MKVFVNQKIVVVLVTIILLITFGTCYAVPDGDLTGDGRTDIADALRALRIAVRLVQPTSQDVTDGDVAPLDLLTLSPKGNGQVDISDALAILRYAVGLDKWNNNTLPVASFAGIYSGTYSGADSGTVTVTLATDGSISGSGRSTVDPGYQFTISGQVTSDGNVNLQGTGSAGTATFIGTVTSQGVLAGTWSDGETGGGTFTLLGYPPNADPAPSVTGISPSTGAPGTTVTITGTYFSTTPANNTVKFNGTQTTVTAATATSLTVAVPSGATTGTVSVTTVGGTGTSAGIFTVDAASFSGTVAMGAAVQDAEVSLRTLDGEIVSTISDAMGGWLVPFSSFKKLLTPPFIVKARFTVAGRVVDLFSMSTDDAGGNIKMNITPVTDMITRAYEPLYSTNPDTVEGLPNDPGKLAQIIGGARIVLGELLPPATRNNADFIRDPFDPDPLKSDIDALLERTRIGYQNGNVTVADVTGKPMATTSFAKLSSNTVGTGDEETVTKAEADAAIAKRGAFPETTPPYVNEAANGSIPPVPPVILPAPTNFTATKTGDYSWKLTWNPVAGAVQYFVYQKKGSAPSVASGLYDQSSTNPPFIVTGGNSTSAHYQVDTEGTYYWVLAAVGTDGTENEKGLPTSFVGVPTAAASLTFVKATTGVISYISVYSDIDGTGYMGRGELAVGQSVQLKARARYSDSTLKEIGPLVTWQWEKYVSLPPPLPGAKLTLSASGLLTAISSGYAWFGREVYAIYIENGITYYDSYIFYEP